MDPRYLWTFYPLGYLLTIVIETPVLLAGLSKKHPLARKVLAGIWLTACTYPVVVLVFPMLIRMDTSRMVYLLVAETFAPLAECLLFWLAFHRGSALSRTERWRDYGAIVLANVASFGIGELLHAMGWLPYLWSNLTPPPP